MRTTATLFALLALVGACGGGGEAPVELEIDRPATVIGRTAILTGSSFVPEGSNCPASNEFVRVGTLGPHEIAYTNAATGTTGPVFDELWVCNSGDGRTMSWRSNPITLASGANVVTVRMTASGRESQASITIQAP